MTHILNPNTVPPIPAGQNQTFTVLATDAAGTPVPNAPVALMIGGAHSLQLNGITGADGQISFNYAGANPGTDTVQALGTVTGMFALSNQVTVTWGTPTPTPPSTPPPGLSLSVAGAKLLTLPDPAVYTATATDPGLPAGGTIAISWIQLSGPATVTFATPLQAVTSVTFPSPASTCCKPPPPIRWARKPRRWAPSRSNHPMSVPSRRAGSTPSSLPRLPG
jgi:hypothetical protein